MRIAFISDIHGNLPALEAVKKDILQRGVDQIVNLGDSLSGPLLPRETAQFIMAEGWYSLAGNHERQILAEEGLCVIAKLSGFPHPRKHQCHGQNAQSDTRADVGGGIEPFAFAHQHPCI